jgi:hypothetical protein
LRVQSAIVTVSRCVTTAAGVFAPGHLGELTQLVPFELVDAVLAETGKVQQRLRALPSRVGVYFVLALGLFTELGYLRVWDKLTGAFPQPGQPPTEKALRDLRRRLGAVPLRSLFEVVAGPLAQPRTPGVSYRRFRTVAFDGCSSIRVPDAERNRGWLGKIRYKLAWAGYPTLMLMTLVETGTRGLLGAVFGPHDSGEQSFATRLVHLLGPDMLVLADRGFDGNEFLTAVAARHAQFLVRLRAARRLPVLARLDDGSFLTKLADLTVRIIDADITLTCSDGTVVTGRYRLATTLLDPRLDPAPAMVRLYHERWEIESAYYALRHTLMHGRVLRSGDPFGVEQEMWALLTLYQILRTAMVAAIESVPGTDPDRASFTTAMQAARDQIIRAAGILPDQDAPIDLVGVIGRAVLADLLPARRHRTSVRKVKSPTSRYHTHPSGDPRPPSSQTITSTIIDIHEGHSEPPPPPASSGTPKPPNRLDQLLVLLRGDPERVWHTRDIAEALRIDNGRSLWVQLSRWAKLGLIRKADWGTYTAATPTPNSLTPAPKPPSRLQRLKSLLHAEPQRIWPRKLLAEALGIPPAKLQSFYGQLSNWTTRGLIHRTTPGRYSLTPHKARV